MRVGILGLGNELLADDAVGLLVAERVRLRAKAAGYEIRESSAGGMDLMEDLVDLDGVIIVDAVETGRARPGRIWLWRAEELPYGRRLRGAHDADLASILELGRRMGRPLPAQVLVLGVEVLDPLTIGGIMSPLVAQAVPAVSRWALRLAGKLQSRAERSSARILMN